MSVKVRERKPGEWWLFIAFIVLTLFIVGCGSGPSAQRYQLINVPAAPPAPDQSSRLAITLNNVSGVYLLDANTGRVWWRNTGSDFVEITPLVLRPK